MKILYNNEEYEAEIGVFGDKYILADGTKISRYDAVVLNEELNAMEAIKYAKIGSNVEIENNDIIIKGVVSCIERTCIYVANNTTGDTVHYKGYMHSFVVKETTRCTVMFVKPADIIPKKPKDLIDTTERW